MAAVNHDMSPKVTGLSAGSALTLSIQRRVIALATTPSVTATIQRAAQRVLQTGWTVLLPSVEERTRTLLSLLPSAGEMRVNTIMFVLKNLAMKDTRD